MKKTIGYIQIILGILMIILSTFILNSPKTLDKGSNLDTWIGQDSFAGGVLFIVEKIGSYFFFIKLSIYTFSILFILQGVVNLRSKN